MQDESTWVRADFNGVFGDLLCLSHSDEVATESGEVVRLRSGMQLTAFDDDADDRGKPEGFKGTGYFFFIAGRSRLRSLPSGFRRLRPFGRSRLRSSLLPLVSACLC